MNEKPCGQNLSEEEKQLTRRFVIVIYLPDQTSTPDPQGWFAYPNALLFASLVATALFQFPSFKRHIRFLTKKGKF